MSLLEEVSAHRFPCPVLEPEPPARLDSGEEPLRGQAAGGGTVPHGVWRGDRALPGCAPGTLLDVVSVDSHCAGEGRAAPFLV